MNATNEIRLILPAAALRAVYNATPKRLDDVRYYLNGVCIQPDTGPGACGLTLIGTNGYIMATYHHVMEKEDLADLVAWKASSGRESIIIAVDGAKGPRAKAGTVTLVLKHGAGEVSTCLNLKGAPQIVEYQDGMYPDWQRVDTWGAHVGVDDGWTMGTGKVGFNVGYLHCIWPEGWAIYYHPDKPGVLRCQTLYADGLSDVRVTLMGMRP